MKANLLVLVLCGMLPITSAKIFHKASSPPSKIPLSMMKNSIDDMYIGCTKEMDEKVKREYFPRENKMKSFANAWKSAEKYLNKKRKNVDKALTKNHLQAICLYTAGGQKNFYDTFNRMVRDNSAVYNTNSFPYHAVHFWLTSAIQILSSINQPCHTTYRRTNVIFTGKINQIIRFGTFASSSFKTNLVRFGKETCFHIKTCLGAYLKTYPTLGNHEEEVLIPPYEMFKIVNITTQPYQNLSDCKKIFVLASVGVKSNLNCKAANAKKAFIVEN